MPTPPATSTVPSPSGVAVWYLRAADNLPAAVHVPPSCALPVDGNSSTIRQSTFTRTTDAARSFMTSSKLQRAACDSDPTKASDSGG